MTVNLGSVSDRLLELQTIDQSIWETRLRIDSFQPRLAELEAPALELEKAMEVTGNKLRDLNLEERRLRLSAEEKRVRVQRLEGRLDLIRTVREEEAVQKELGIVGRALDQEEQEIVNVLDQIGTHEDRHQGQEAALEEAREELGPRRQELSRELEAAKRDLVTLEERRERRAQALDPMYRRVYDNLVQGGRRVAVAPMTGDGACGACFSMIPLQVQHEIRAHGPLRRCEFCGVIVTAPDDEKDKLDQDA